MITVKELIDILSKCNPDAKVIVSSYGEMTRNEISPKDIIKKPTLIDIEID